jgi:hypothetical protein
MEDPALQRGLKWIMAQIICAPALLMPYRMRAGYARAISAIVHSPFRAFGRLAQLLLDLLAIEPAPQVSSSSPEHFVVPDPEPAQSDSVAILFSGGTDSTCVAARMAETHAQVHLLTFYEHATRSSTNPVGNVELLKAHFPKTSFVHHLFSVDALVRHFSYERYLRNVREHGLLMLATPGFSSLSWHTRTITYCMDHDITEVADGLTRELMHFPGHMDEVVEQIRLLYERFGIRYHNPVREWPTPRDQQFIDKVLVNRHEEFNFGGMAQERRTTGRYLFELGLFPSDNVKGSRFDQSMQHDCYPFGIYNVLAFWGRLTFEPYPLFCDKISNVMRKKIEEAAALLDEYRADPRSRSSTALFNRP